MEKCQLYEKGMAQEREFFGNEIVFCPVTPKNCPYGKAIAQTYQGDPVGTVCISRGLVKKVNENANFRLDKKEVSLPIRIRELV